MIYVSFIFFIFFFRMYILFAILLLGSGVKRQASASLDRVWEEWKVKHSKSYDNQVGFFFFLLLSHRCKEGRGWGL